MTLLPAIDDLPDSTAYGPESWGEAWGYLGETTDIAQGFIENSNADATARHDAYEDYIGEVYQATGVRLPNPMNVDLATGAFQEGANPTYGFGSGNEWRQERVQNALDRFEAERTALAEKYPAQARLIQLNIDDRVVRKMQLAEKDKARAAASPALGPIGRFTAQLYGGLKGSLRDPLQVGFAIAGGGAGGARTVIGRLGHVMLTEALINGGQEAVLQAASQDRKEKAGLKHGLEDALQNIGVAATFGALFGGTLQGAGELARIYSKSGVKAEQFSRVIDGNPEPGDIEAVAKAMGLNLDQRRQDMIARGFEERTLEDYALPADATPEQMRVYDAAQRYAAEPDNFPPPELVERMIADEQSGPARTMTADDYERVYGGDANAIDDARARLMDETAPEGEIIAPETAKIAPQRAIEPSSPDALSDAEKRAGGAVDGQGAAEFPEPAVDANGNIKNPFDLLGIEDGKGNHTQVSVREALALADEPNFYADILEACKL